VPNRHRLLILAAISGAAALANPFGPEVWAYAAGLSTNSFVTGRISEWQPTSLRTIPGILFFGSAAVVVAFIARLGRRVPWPTLAILGLFAAIGTYAIRGVAWWPLGAAVALAGLLAAAPPAEPSDAAARRPVRTERSSRVNLVVAGMIVAICVVLLPIWRAVDARIGAPAGVVGDAPPGITAAIRDLARPGDRLLNPQPWGSWFELALPGVPIAIDSRIEVFPVKVWDDFDRVRSGGDGWQATLASWGVTIAVARDDESAFVARLRGAGWRQVYADDDGSVLVAASR
jgi:hypothetical protein